MEATIDALLTKNLIAFSTHRQHVYGLLSRCFEREIDACFAHQLAAFKLEGESTVVQALTNMKYDLLDTSSVHLEQLAVVFNRIFYGMGPRACQKAFPYESVYTSPDALLMQEAYSSVVQEYRTACFVKNHRFTEPEDHLAVELAFMSAQNQAAISALETGDEDAAECSFRAQCVFLEQHLLNWIHPFASDMRKASEGGFYYHLAQCTEAFLQADKQALLEVLGEEG